MSATSEVTSGSSFVYGLKGFSGKKALFYVVMTA